MGHLSVKEGSRIQTYESRIGGNPKYATLDASEIVSRNLQCTFYNSNVRKEILISTGP